MPNLAGLIFSSVTSFQLQPEKTKVVNKRDNLDTLSEVYTGPAGGEDSFIPAIGSFHRDYNLMTLINVSVKQLPALVVEVTLNYHGKLANSGTGRYTSVPTFSRYWQEGEVSYQGGYFTYSHHYTGRCVSVAYITNAMLAGNPTNLGLAKEFLGFTNEWLQLIANNPDGGFVIQAGPTREMRATDMRIEDQGNGWYQVTETYMSRMFPGAVLSTGQSQPPGPASKTPDTPNWTSGNHLMPGDPNRSDPNQYRDTATLAAGWNITEANAEYMATHNQYGDTIQQTPIPDWGAPPSSWTHDQQVMVSTAMDPAWGSTVYATASASGSISTVYNDLGGADGTVASLLDF